MPHQPRMLYKATQKIILMYGCSEVDEYCNNHFARNFFRAKVCYQNEMQYNLINDTKLWGTEMYLVQEEMQDRTQASWLSVWVTHHNLCLHLLKSSRTSGNIHWGQTLWLLFSQRVFYAMASKSQYF